MKTKVVIHKNRLKTYFKDSNQFIRYKTDIPVLSKSQFYRYDPQNHFNPISSEGKGSDFYFTFLLKELYQSKHWKLLKRRE